MEYTSTTIAPPPPSILLAPTYTKISHLAYKRQPFDIDSSMIFINYLRQYNEFMLSHVQSFARVPVRYVSVQFIGGGGGECYRGTIQNIRKGMQNILIPGRYVSYLL